MKRTLALTMGVVGMVALVGCGGSNPAGPNAQRVSFSSVQEHIFIDPTQVQTSPEERLVGAWERLNAAITFKKGGEVALTGSAGNGTPFTVSGTYKVDDNKLTLTTDATEELMDPSVGKDARPILSQFATYTYSIQGNVLILTDHNRQETEWQKR